MTAVRSDDSTEIDGLAIEISVLSPLVEISSDQSSPESTV